MPRLLAFVLVVCIAPALLPAQDFAGVWQGRTTNGSRTVLKLERRGADRWSAVEHVIDKEPDGFAGSVVVNMHAFLKGAQRYTDLRCPALAFYAVPPDSADAADMQAQATAFEKGVPGARVVRLTNATHWVWESNEADVLREMNVFIGELPE